ALLAGGISKKLITSAGGIIVAVPTMYFHHFLSAKINNLIMHMEMESVRLVEILHGEREVESEARK
ncbi:MAG TPA: MotA/TolQ/ExbB proton channel family protein, partial [Pseudomonadales bacterium]|nr:MotA/TolQ/ExbB proton channel family protein [Pseudomonadales bacterium]